MWSPLTRSTDGRPTAALAVLLMALLAGCAGVVSGLPFTAPQPYTETGAALNASELGAAHADGLESAETFRSNVTLDLVADDTTVRVERTATANATAERALSTTRYGSDAVTGDGLTVSAYTDGDVTYRRTALAVGDKTVTDYDAARSPYEEGLLHVRPVTTADAARVDLVSAVVADVDWTQAGVERHDGDWVTRYEASGPANFSAIGESALAEATGDRTNESEVPETLDLDVRSANATLLVSPDGVVRHLAVHATGNAGGVPVELRLTFSTDGLGSTVVEPPAWLEDAQDATSP